MKKLALLALVVLTLTGCAPLGMGKQVNRLPKYQKPPEVHRFGDWFVEPGACLIQSASTDLRADTDGQLDGGMLPIRLRFAPQLVRPPLTTLSGLPVPIPQEGSGKTFVVRLAYDSTTAAYMLREHTYLTVQYESLTSGGTTLEANLQTRSLLQAIAFVAQSCK
jgi:hypothetical protein